MMGTCGARRRSDGPAVPINYAPPNRSSSGSRGDSGASRRSQSIEKQVSEFGCSFIGLTSFILTCFVTLSPTWRVWGMEQCLSQDELLAPLLSTGPLLQLSSYSLVRRTIYWFLALLHSVNATLFLQKRLLLLEKNFHCNGLFSECTLPIVALIACIAYLVHLCWTCFPGKEVIFAGCTVYIFYFSIAFTSLVYTNTTIAFEVVHIFITIVVNILRFSSQDKIPERGWFSLTVAVTGTIIGFQWLLLYWCINVEDTKLNPHIAYKVGSHWLLLSQLLIMFTCTSRLHCICCWFFLLFGC